MALYDTRRCILTSFPIAGGSFFGGKSASHEIILVLCAAAVVCFNVADVYISFDFVFLAVLFMVIVMEMAEVMVNRKTTMSEAILVAETTTASAMILTEMMMWWRLLYRSQALTRMAMALAHRKT